MAGVRSDQELIQASQRGDMQAFEQLYLRYRDWVVALAYRFCGHHDDALDVLQETFAYVVRKLPGFVLSCQFKTFLYPAVKHIALNRKRASQAHVPLADSADPPVETARSHGREVLAGLPDEQQEVVWLRFVDGMDLKDIAETMGIPLGTVKSRLHTALQTLRSKRNL